MKTDYNKRTKFLTIILITILFTNFCTKNSEAQDLGQGYKCVEVSILDQKNKVIKLEDAKKNIQKKIKAANSIKNAKKKKAKKAALNAVKTAMDQCASGAFIIQSAVFDVEKEQCTSKKYDVNVQFLPAKTGRAISIQISSDNGATFSSIAAGADNGTGVTLLSFNAPDQAGTYLYRAYADAFPPLVAGSSGAIEAKVSPCGSDVVNDTLPVIRPGGEHSCLLTGEGDAWCWGSNKSGNLGNGTNIDSTKAVKVAGGLKFTSLTAGYIHNCALEADGTAWCWGDNFDALLGSGALGDGTTEDRNVPTKVTGGLKFKKLSAGTNHTCGIDQYNQVYCWGSNDFSQIGISTPPVQNNSQDVTVPKRINSSKNYIDIVVHGRQSCAVTTDKMIDCWGDDSGTSYSGNTAVFSPDIDKILTQLGSGYTKVALGTRQRCGLLPSGTIQCWQVEVDGSFGNGTPGSSGKTPVDTLGGPYTSLSFGSRNGCGIVENGDAYCWGYNLNGAIGNGKGGNINENRSSPQLVINGLKWRQVVLGYGHVCGISLGGSPYCWGANFQGQLGNGTSSFIGTFAPSSVLFSQ